MSVNEILQSALELSYEEQRELRDKLSQRLEDENLKIDPYFYERKEHLHKTMEMIDSGELPLGDWDEFEKEMDEFEKELAIKYAN